MRAWVRACVWQTVSRKLQATSDPPPPPPRTHRADEAHITLRLKAIDFGQQLIHDGVTMRVGARLGAAPPAKSVDFVNHDHVQRRLLPVLAPLILGLRRYPSGGWMRGWMGGWVGGRAAAAAAAAAAAVKGRSEKISRWVDWNCGCHLLEQVPDLLL